MRSICALGIQMQPRSSLAVLRNRFKSKKYVSVDVTQAAAERRDKRIVKI